MTQELETMSVLYQWEKPMERRGFLGFIGKVGFAAIGATAGLIALTDEAAAAPPCTCTAPNFACCSLNMANNCPKDQNGQGICASPHWAFTWYCCFCGGSRTYACMECEYQDNGTCCVDVSKTVCSAYWTVAPNTCTCTTSCSCQNVIGCF